MKASILWATLQRICKTRKRPGARVFDLVKNGIWPGGSKFKVSTSLLVFLSMYEGSTVELSGLHPPAQAFFRGMKKLQNRSTRSNHDSNAVFNYVKYPFSQERYSVLNPMLLDCVAASAPLSRNLYSDNNDTTQLVMRMTSCVVSLLSEYKFQQTQSLRWQVSNC
jgi:hypothetical protein